MPARKKTANAAEIHRVEKPGGLVAIYERHDDGTVTRRVENALSLTEVTATPLTGAGAIEGGDAA